MASYKLINAIFGSSAPDVPDLEDITAELEGIAGTLIALSLNYSEGDNSIRISPDVLYNCFYGMEAHLERIIKDLKLLILEERPNDKQDNQRN